MAELHHPMPFIVGEQCLGSASAAISAVEKKKFYVIVVFLMQHFQGFFLQQIEIKGLMQNAYGGFRFVYECSHTPISH